MHTTPEIELALSLVKDYGFRDPKSLAKALKIKILTYSDVSERTGKKIKLRGYASIQAGRKYIHIRENLSPYMEMMVIAHEIGHLLLHGDILRKGSPLLDSKLFGLRDRVEYEANVFAAFLLLDKDDVMKKLTGGYTQAQTAASCNVDVKMLNLFLKELIKRKEIPAMDIDTPEVGFLGTINDDYEEDWT